MKRADIISTMPGELKLVFFEEADSTNRIAKELAAQGAAEGTVVLAARQTAGRGRLGRSFLSPEGGIYLTMIMRPEAHVQSCTALTMAACVGVWRALDDIGIAAGIKWVNDLYVRGRKVCGILTEGAVGPEGMLKYALVGVGLNYASGNFEGELANIAGSLFSGNAPMPAGRMAGRLMGRLYQALKNPYSPDIYREYKENSLLLGRQVNILRGGGEVALAFDITPGGGLMVRHPDGREEELNSGEVSVRL